MRVFRELDIAAPPQTVQIILARLEEQAEKVGSGWKRDGGKETDLKSLTPMYCFTCTTTASRPGAALWLVAKGPGLYVSNVVPTELREISRDQYNAIVEEFHDTLVVPAVETTGAKVDLGPTVVSLDRWLSPETFTKLKRFCELANRSTGSGHPHDRARWRAFLFAAHDEGAPLDSSELQQWLTEDDGWHEDGATKLAFEYDAARDLLQAYDQYRAEHDA